jgi:hypothetical protein
MLLIPEITSYRRSFAARSDAQAGPTDRHSSLYCLLLPTTCWLAAAHRIGRKLPGGEASGAT